MVVKRINFTKEDATNLYLENYRYKVLQELKVQEIQNKIKNKLLNKTNKEDNLDLIFYKNTISGFNLSEMSNLLSNENISEMTDNNKNISEMTGNNKNISEMAGNNENISEMTDSNENISEMTGISKEGDDFFTERKILKKNKYIDLEAECSSEEEEIEEEELEEDISFIDDQDHGDEINHHLFYDEKEKEDQILIRRLKSKFKKRKPSELEKAIIEVEESEEYEQGFSEMDMEIEAVKFRKVEFEDVKEEKEDILDGGIDFNNLGIVDNKKENFNFLMKKNSK